MEERRKHSRTVIKERAYVSSGGSVMTCWVRNISPEGAAIEVESPAFVPPSFRLVMASGSSVHECRIAWLQKNRIGVTFTGKSEPTVFKQIQLKPSERRTPYLQNLCPEMHRSHVTGDGGYMVESTDDIDTREARVLLFHGRETHSRSILKAISWRTLGTLDTFAISWFMTGRIEIAGSIAGLEIITKVGWYYLHERVWAGIGWGGADGRYG